MPWRLYLLTLVLAGLQDVHQPLQLVGGVGGVHQQPEVFSGAEVHVQGDHSEARLDLHGVEASKSGEMNACCRSLEAGIHPQQPLNKLHSWKGMGSFVKYKVVETLADYKGDISDLTLI